MSEPRPQKFRATIEYDGAGFAGFQVQPSVRTVQGALESGLSRLMDAPVRIRAAGRTDTGVHATAQEIAFATPASWTAEELKRSLDAVLPADVGVHGVSRIADAFHPRFDATGRRYEYYVAEPGPGPLRASRVWSPGSSLDLEVLARASVALTGRRSFEALAKSGQPDLGTECSVESADWARTALGDLQFTIVADRFLHRMVRYIVRSLVDVATGRRDAAEWIGLLENEGARPPEPAPARALYLTGVRYPDGWNRPAGVPGLSPVDSSSEPTRETT